MDNGLTNLIGVMGREVPDFQTKRHFRFNSEATHRRNHGYGCGVGRDGSGGIRSVGAEQPEWWRTWAEELTERADIRAAMPPIGGLIVPPLHLR
jgi:hypothetical protein